MIGLVSSRLARRRGAAGLVALAIAAAIVVVGSLFGVGVVTADIATRQALADLPPRERAVAVNRHADSQFDDAGADAAVQAAFGHLGDMAGAVLDAISFQPAIGFTRYFALDDVGARVVLSEGRLPAPCDGRTTCEGIRVSSFEVEGQGSLGSTSQLGDLAVTVVGIAEIAPGLPLDPSGANGVVVLLDGVAALATSAALENVPRTRFWVAPIDPERAHSWRLPELRDAIDDVERSLASEDAAYVVNAPDEAFLAVEGRTATASGRLVFIASMIVALLLAFAVFAAAIEREDVGLEYGRLRTSGARRGQLLLFVVAEAGVPAIAGAVIGWAAAAALVGVIAIAAGAAPLAVLGVSLLEPASLAVVAAIAVLAAIAVGIGIHPGSGRLVQPRLIAVAVLPAVAVLAWDRLVSGSLDATALAGQALGPGTVLFPGLVGLALILVSLVVIPRIFRALARRGRRAPLALRLSLVATAREPLRPAATTTLLAFGVGAAVFAMSHGQTLARGAADAAAFTTGMDVWVSTLGHDGELSEAVLPAIRGDFPGQPGEGTNILGDEARLFPLLWEPTVTASGRRITLLGIDAAAIPELRGWRPDFSDRSPAELAAAIAMPGDWSVPGHDLPTGARSVDVEVEASGDAVRLTAIVDRAGTGFSAVILGDLVEGRQTLHGELFDFLGPGAVPSDFPAGWRVVAIRASNGGTSAAIGAHAGERQEADVRFLDLDGLFLPEASFHLDVSGSHAAQALRPAAPTDGVDLRAIVSPDLADDVGDDGAITISLPGEVELRVRPVAEARWFPTITDTSRSLVVVDAAPLMAARNADAPGAGLANELLIRTPDDAATARVVATLSDRDHFPPLRILSRPVLEAARANDPFALGVLWALAVGALAGIGLSIAGIVLAAVARLRDERGDLGELEEQGVAPDGLRLLAALQAVLLAGIGTVTGIVVGLALGWLAASSLAVGGTGEAPVPPLVLVAPWLAIAALAAGLVAGLGLAVAGLARRHYASGLLRGAGR